MTPKPAVLTYFVEAPMVKSAQALGLAGLIPFVALSVAPMAGAAPAFAGNAFNIYSALILSFLGGIRWGLVAPTAASGARRDLTIGIGLSLLAFAALLLGPLTGLAVLTTGHLLALLADWRWPPLSQPAWLTRLRLQLSSGVLVCHALSWLSIIGS